MALIGHQNHAAPDGGLSGRIGRRGPRAGYGGGMFARTFLRRVARWARRAHARRKARLTALQRVDERLVDFSHRLRDGGTPYDTWRQTLPVARRPGGGW